MVVYEDLTEKKLWVVGCGCERSKRKAAMAEPTGRKVLITGVSKGLGRALALELANRGHTIIGCSRDQTQLHSLQQQLSNTTSPNQHFFFKLDVTSDKDVQQFAQIVANNNLVPHILVNNAGLAHKSAKLWELDAQEFDNVMDTNVKGTANVLRHFIPLMIQNNNGIIVNMSSSAGRSAHEDFAPYCSSKWAVEGLSKCIAKGLPDGMAIVALNPGSIHTDMLVLCCGASAAQFQSPQKWAIKAATMILDLTPKDNGESLTVENPRELSAA